MRFRLGFVAGMATGYYLGARAGRERYNQIKRTLARIRRTDTYGGVTELAKAKVEEAAKKAKSAVEEGVEKARAAVDSRVADSSDTATPNSATSNAGTNDAGTNDAGTDVSDLGGYSSSR